MFLNTIIIFYTALAIVLPLPSSPAGTGDQETSLNLSSATLSISDAAKPDSSIELDIGGKTLVPGEVTPINAEDLKPYAKVDLLQKAGDPAKLVVQITPTGKPGKDISLRLQYNKDDSTPKTLTITFGSFFKAIDCPAGSVVPTAFTAGKEETICVEDGGHNPLPANKAATGKDSKNFEVTDRATAGELKVKTLAAGDSKLVIAIDGFSYVLIATAKSTELINGISLENGVSGTIVAKDPAHPLEYSLNIRGNAKVSVKLVANTLAGNKQVLEWLGKPTASVDGCIQYNRGVFEAQGSSLGKPKCIVSFPLSDKPDKTELLDSSLRGKALNVAINNEGTAAYLEVNTIETGPVLVPGGRVRARGIVRKTGDNSPDAGAGIVTFDIPDPKEKIWVSLVNEGNAATLTVRNPTPEEIRAAYGTPTAPRPGFIGVKATAKSSNGEDVYAGLEITLGFIKKFDELKVKLDIMDDRTAKDLYGTVTANEYYVLNVRLNNNIRDGDSGQPTGNSIIAYSGSLEVAVGLEKKWNSSKKSSSNTVLSAGDYKEVVEKARADTGNGVLSNPADYQTSKKNIETDLDQAKKDRDDLYSDFEKAYAAYTAKIAQNKSGNESEEAWNAATAAQAAYKLAQDGVARIQRRLAELETARLRHYWSQKVPPIVEVDEQNNPISVDDGLWHPVTRTDFRRLAPSIDLPDTESFLDDPLGHIPSPTELEKLRSQNIPDDVEGVVPPCVGTITYRPMTFEMAVNTVDRREERSLRSNVFKILDAVGSATSFVTAIAVPGPGSDLPLGLEKYRNLFMPAADRLFPSIKEQHRQNIVAQTMKPIEEIPYGSDITRVIFIPKKRIQGLILGHDVRIAAVCPFYFKIEVAEIQSTGSVTQGVSRP